LITNEELKKNTDTLLIESKEEYEKLVEKKLWTRYSKNITLELPYTPEEGEVVDNEYLGHTWREIKTPTK
jgi:hypothetical protein